ncbi:MAG: L,D-transpeptidase family protein [Verrucomicrobiota bacterium]
MSTRATFLGPVNQLPAEGDDQELNLTSEIDLCASAFSESSLLFDVSEKGVMMQSNPQSTEVFQQFDVQLEKEEGEPYLLWRDNAFELQLQGLVSNRSAFSTLSDASEPEDYVRRFLEVLGSSLDDPALEHEGAKLPMIRWEAAEDGSSARVQLLGVLLANDDQFEKFCASNDGNVGLIFEDAEVEAHGVREALTVLALVGITLGATTEAEAGLFKKMKEKKEMRIAQINHQKMIVEAQAPIQQQYRSGYRDVHQNHYVNHQLLEARSSSGEKKVIVDVANQRAYLLVDNMVAIDTAVSTARTGKETPRGTFKITQRVAEGKTSTIYGCDLPYWQRLDGSAIGMHTGDLPGYPASAGCIRLPESIAPILFANTASGVTVEVVDHWDQQELHQAGPQNNMIVAQVVPEDGNS